MVRFVIFCCTASWILAAIPGSAASQYAQYYPPPSYYGRPPDQAVTPGPLRGAARSAAGGALFGAIGGNAGRGSAIGAGVGAVGGAGASEAQIAPGLWEVERVGRSDLLGAADDDRAAAAMLYYGYLAAKGRIRVIEARSTRMSAK
jgi:Glycine-zipper domain